MRAFVLGISEMRPRGQGSADFRAAAPLGWQQVLLCAALVLSSATVARADQPLFASLRSDKAYLREGPTYAHKVLWLYRRKGYPVEVVQSYENWRRVRDADGTVGWMNAAMLSPQRTVLVIGTARAEIHADSLPSSKVVAFAEPGVVAKLKACKPRLCEVASGGIDGWIEKKNIWGVVASDDFQ